MTSAHWIVLVGDRRAKRRIEIAAFVANRQLEQRAIVAR
jgi:hypothetical protein